MFCRACGATLLKGAGFCGNCGTPAVEAVQPVAQAESPAAADIAAGAGEFEQPTMVRPPADLPGRPVVPPPTSRPSVVFTPPGYAAQAGPNYGHSGSVGPAPGGYGAPGGPAGPGAYGAPPYNSPPQKKDRLALWIGLAATAIIVIGAVVAVWLLVIDKDEVASTSTTKVAQSTTTTARTTTSSATSTTASTSPSTSVTLPLGAPGDSAGQWAEVNIPGLPAEAYAVAVSEEALLIDVGEGAGYALYAYLFDSEQLIELPIDGPDFGGEDIDGLMAVWWEGAYDEGTTVYSDEHIYAYALPNGPKVEIAGDRSVYYPQIAGQLVTWVEEEPWAENPDEYWFSRIFGVTIDAGGNPQGDPVELVPAATGFAQGDAGWSYSLSETHLAWENATAVDIFDPGVYTLDLATLQPSILAPEVWRPSTAGGRVVYTDAGLVTADLNGGVGPVSLDPQGDFASAAPTFAAYFRFSERDGTSSYDIVARGYTGTYEQTLGSQPDAPWLSASIAVSAGHVAFIVDGTVHVFEWQGPKTY